MIQMKEEIFSLVRENYKLRVKAVETQGEAKVKDLLAKMEDQDRSIKKRENDLRDEKRKEASGGWEKGEKQRILEDFQYLKTLYEKDKKLMEGLLDESQRKLRSANAIVHSLESTIGTALGTTQGSCLPLKTVSTSSPSLVTVFWVMEMVLVGLKAM